MPLLKRVAQLALSFILNFSRNTIKTHLEIKRGAWPKYSGFLIKDKIIGIIGFEILVEKFLV